MKTRSAFWAGLMGLAVAMSLVVSVGGSVRLVRAAPAVQTGDFITVTVKPGETLATYARLFGTSGGAILRVNPNIENGNIIYPGQVIVIPVIRSTTPSLTTPFYYTAQEGDTLVAVSRRFELDPGAIARANGVAELTPGQTYLMPAGPHVYYLRPGDTLRTVAQRYRVSIDFLLNGNSLPNPDLVYAGQPIFIPIIFDAQPLPITELPPPASTATPGPTATLVAPPGFIAVTVQPGDSLVTYVNRYKVSASAIIAANPSIQANPALLFPGQVLLIPVGSATATAVAATPGLPPLDGNYIRITAQAGDTLLTYVQTYSVTASAIIAVNPELWPDPNIIRVGQTITIPIASAVTPTPTGTPVPAQTVPPTATRTPTPAPNLTPISGNFIQITVRRGESLATYVTRYGVSGSSILAVNPSIQANPALIFVGQTLVIPVPVSFTPSRTTPFFYEVAAGENAATIALKFEMATDTLTRANPGVTIAPGATILVPAGPHLYTVKPGDELRDIAALYGTTVEFLLTGNSLPNPDLIYPGQLIFIPVQYNAAPKPF